MQGHDVFEAARECLSATDPAEKIALTHRHAARLRGARRVALANTSSCEAIGEPGRPEKPCLIEPRLLPQRGLGSAQGRAALVHAVAHIEFNAINLAWDAVHRFRDMPDKYYQDWIRVADDEARHFTWLADRLGDLGHAYGDFDAHNGLWEMAVRTEHSCLERMALVPRVLEARGLDVTPGMIDRLRKVGDHATVKILEQILREEVSHVDAGSRWFAWCCARAGVESERMFVSLLDQYLKGSLRGPFNHEARLRAGFSAAEMAYIGTLAA